MVIRRLRSMKKPPVGGMPYIAKIHLIMTSSRHGKASSWRHVIHCKDTLGHDVFAPWKRLQLETCHTLQRYTWSWRLRTMKKAPKTYTPVLSADSGHCLWPRWDLCSHLQSEPSLLHCSLANLDWPGWVQCFTDGPNGMARFYWQGGKSCDPLRLVGLTTPKVGSGLDASPTLLIIYC